MRKYGELNYLKGKITERGETYRSLSKKTNIPLNSLSNKINGHSAFDIVQVSRLCAELDIDPREIPKFFLPADCVSQQTPQHR